MVFTFLLDYVATGHYRSIQPMRAIQREPIISYGTRIVWSVTHTHTLNFRSHLLIGEPNKSSVIRNKFGVKLKVLPFVRLECINTKRIAHTERCCSYYATGFIPHPHFHK